MSWMQSFLEDIKILLCLWLSPFLAGAISILLTAGAIMATFQSMRRKRKTTYWFLFLIALLFDLYSLFNVYDYCRYAKYGLAVSPLNQITYYLFLSPSDLYAPCVKIPLSASKEEYEMTYRHKYGGRQNIILYLVNNTPKVFEYDNPDKINLAFDAKVSCSATGTEFESHKQFETYYLLPGTNYMFIGEYIIDEPRLLSSQYNVKIRTSGSLTDFLSQYPGSWLEIHNGASK